ncbi:PREDICTED: uncharacterized protein LOC109158690 [Ipomoea nil]|uniref:uncharacterized protein LOC109158690 n=1 Tax=Ipomoea nil TaxID=35883 RepID=UPI000901C282|nr:PREDICTED: uncharacterized protein LOC109158690 [Ipomoea nil]
MGFRRLRDMNLSLLGKQAWRLLTQPNSLMSRIYKARYFPNSTFFDATLGSNPSFIWRGLVEVQDIVKMGSHWCIGDGKSTRIGCDPWMPDVGNPHVVTQLHESVSMAPVSSLMNEHGTAWDVDCVEDVFEERDARLILSIPISCRKPPDAWT